MSSFQASPLANEWMRNVLGIGAPGGKFKTLDDYMQAPGRRPRKKEHVFGKLQGLNQGQAMLDSVNNFGKSMFDNINDFEKTAGASTTQRMIDRGLGNSTVASNVQRGVGEAATRMRGDVHDTLRDRDTAIRQQIASLVFGAPQTFQPIQPMPSSGGGDGILGALGGIAGSFAGSEAGAAGIMSLLSAL